MPSEKFFVHKEDGSLVRLKGRLVRFLDEEPPTGSDKSAIRTALEVSPDAEGLVQADIGTDPNQLVLHQHLGDISYQSADSVAMGTVSISDKIDLSGAPTQQLEIYGDAPTVRVTDTSDGVGDGDSIGKLEFYGSDGSSGGVGVRAKIDTVSETAAGNQYGVAISTSTANSAPVERVRVDGQGNVKLTGDETELQFNSDTQVGNNVRARIQCEGQTGTYGYGGDLVIKTTADDNTSAERLRITSSALVMGSGVGIDFGSGASTTIDSYEEGTWTPVFAPNGGSFTTATTFVYIAKYTKVGNLVTANCYIRTDGTLDITGGSSAVRIQGLPFSTTSSNDYVSVNVGYALNWSAVPAGGYVAANNSYILLSKRETSITGNLNASSVSDLDTSGGAKNEIMISVTYQTT